MGQAATVKTSQLNRTFSAAEAASRRWGGFDVDFQTISALEDLSCRLRWRENLNRYDFSIGESHAIFRLYIIIFSNIQFSYCWRIKPRNTRNDASVWARNRTNDLGKRSFELEVSCEALNRTKPQSTPLTDQLPRRTPPPPTAPSSSRSLHPFFGVPP